MRHERSIRWMKWMWLTAVVALTLPFPAMAQTTAREAGSISAMIPVDHVIRQKKAFEAAKDMKLLWGDTVKTERGGRVRVRLNDGSILNVGSQSSLVIETHDTQAQRTQLQLAYGRMRASVVRITQPAGGFEVRTTAAVAGVVGTDVFTEEARIYSTVIALGGGLVTVRSPNPLYADFASILNPGEAITLITDQRPGEKRLATEEELGNAFGETEVDEVVGIEPRATFPGHTYQARIVGGNMAGATAVSFVREGLSMSMAGPATANGIPVSITVAQNVPHGTYPFTVERPQGPQVGVLIVTSEENARRAGAAAPGSMKPPPAQIITAMRGAKFMLDASATQTPAGTSIVAFLWTIEGNSKFSSNQAQFTVNTSLLPPGDYVIQLAVINDRGQTATQRYNLSVAPGIQPAEIIRELASGYESLQPNQFLKYFDEERFRNYSGFAAAIEDSFRSQLETVRVFQRPVNCTISEEQDQAACQVDFELRFTKKEQPSEFLDANGNPFAPGVAAPANAVAAKRLLTGTERSTIRFERADKGWKVTDYAAQVSCPGGDQVTGVNVGSCILALGSFSTPGFQIHMQQLLTSDLFVGSNLSGSFDIFPLGGFNGTVNFTGVGTVLGAAVSAAFTPNPASSGKQVTFTIAAPTAIPVGFTGADPFVFTINGTDASGTISQSANLNLMLKGDFTLTATPVTSPATPLTVTQGGVVSFTVGVVPGSGFPTTGTVVLGIPSLPSGFTLPFPSVSVIAGGSAVLPITVTTASSIGVHTITVQGAFGGLIKTVDLVLLVLQPSFTLTATPVTSLAAPLTVAQGGVVSFTVSVVPGANFPTTGTVVLSIPSLPSGFTLPFPSVSVIAGGSTVLPITVTTVASIGVHTITVQGNFSGLIKTVDLVLDVSPLPPFSLGQFTSPTAPLTLLANSSVVIGITATQNISGFNTPVSLTFGPLPVGVTVTPATANILPGSTQPFTFTFTPSAAGNPFANFGVANVTVTGTAASVPVQTSTIVLNLGTAGSLPFSLFSSPASSTVTLSGTATVSTSFNVFVSSAAAFNQPINISMGTPPPGVTISPNTFVFTPGLSGSSVFYSVTVDPTVAQPGPHPILVSGVSGGISATTTWTLNINGAFSLSVAPNNTQITPMVLPPDGTTQSTVTVTVTSINNFAGSVNVVFSNPFGAPVTVTPGTTQTISVPAGGSANAVFTLVAAVGAANTGTTQAFISASSTTGSATNSLSLPFMTIGPAGFFLSPTSTSTTLDTLSGPGNFPTVVTTVQPLGAFGASVLFSVVPTSVPAGVTVSPSTQTVGARGQASFTISPTGTTVAGLYTIQVNATSPGQTAQTFTISLRLRGSLTLNILQRPGGGPPGSQTVPLPIATGGTLTFDVSVNGINGFVGSTQVQVFSLPSGVTGVFTSSGSSVASGATPFSDVLTLTNVSAAAVSLSQLIVQASDPFAALTNINPQAPIFITTGSPSFVLGCSFGGPATPCNQTNYLFLNINQPGSTDSLDLKIDSVGGYAGTVRVTPVGMPAGMTMSPNPVILSPGQATTVTFSAATPAVAGRFTGFTLVGNDTAIPTLASSTPVDGQMNGSLKLVVTPSTTSSAPAIVAPGGQQVFNVNITGMNGFSGSANLNFSPNLATGMTVSPPCCTIQVTVPAVGSVAATVTLIAAANAPSSFTQSVSFNADGFDASFNTLTYFVSGESSAQSLYVVGPSSFSASVSGATLNNPRFVQVGQQTSIFTSINSIGAFSGTVFLDVTGLPSSITVSSAPGSSATIPVQQGPGVIVIQPQIVGVNVPGASTSATLFFTVGLNAPRGFIQCTLTATSGALVQSIPLVFFVTPQISLGLTPAASSNAPMAVSPGSSASLQIAAAATPSFAGDVDLSFSLPSGVTISPLSPRVTLGGFTTVSINVASSVTAGTRLTINIFAAINGNSVAQTTAVIIAGTGTFGIAVTPATATSSTTPLVINAGSSGVVGVSVSAIGAFSGSVDVSATFTVSTLSTATPTVTISPGGTANFTVNAAAGAQGLIARMFISATGGGQSTSAIVFISIGSGGFSLSVSNNSNTNPVLADIGGSTSFSVLVHQQSGFTGTVSLSGGSLPPSVTLPNNNFLVAAGTTQTFLLQVGPGATAGDTQFTVTGTAGATTINLTVFLRVRGQFTLSLNAGTSATSPLVVAPGGSQIVTVSVVPVGSFFGSVLISTSTFGLPTGVTVSPSSATANPSTPVQFTVSVAAGTGPSPVSAFNISSSGTYSGSFPSANAFVSVATSPAFNMSFFSPLQVDIGNQFGSSINVNLSPVGSYSGTVTLSVTGTLPTGVTVTPTSSTFLLSGFGTSVNLSFRASTAVTDSGPFNVNVNATDGVINIQQQLQVELLANFTMAASAGTNANAPILLAASGSANVNIPVVIVPNITCQGSAFAISLSTSASLPTGVTANVSATANSSSPGVLTVSAAAGAPASSVFSVTVIGDGPPGCSQNQQSVTSYFVVGPGAFVLSAPSFQTGVNINSTSLSSIGVSVNSVGNFQGTVTVSVVTASVPAGVTVTPASAAVAAGNSLNFQVRADTPAVAGTVSFDIQATDGATTQNATIPLLLRGSYTLTISPANSSSQPAVVAPNQTLNYTVTVSPQNGFTGTVSIFQVCCGSLPQGMSATGNFTAAPGSPGQIVVAASATAVASQPQGVSYFSSAPNSFSNPSFGFFGAVGPPGFRVTNFSSVNFPQQVVINGSQRNINVTVQSLGGFSGTVDLALGALPAGLTASPQTAQVTVPAGGSAGFNFAFLASSQLSQGPVDIQLTASQGATSVNTFFYLYASSNIALVQSPPTSSSALLRLIQGDPTGQTLNVQVLNQGGFSGSIQLSVQNVPTGLTVTPTLVSVPANGNASFQITAAAGAAGGSQSFNISASFAGLSAFTTVFLNIGVGNFTLTGSPNSTLAQPIALDPNGTAVVPLSVTVTGANGFQGTVDITPSGLPTGMTVAPATAQVTVPSNGTASTTFSFSATTAQGLTPVTITLGGLSNVPTPAGPIPVSASMQSFFLVNPPTFAITQTGATSGSPLSLEQGIPPGQTFQLAVTGTGTVAISFANVPFGISISPPTANIVAGSSATFTVNSSASAAIGNYIISAVGSSASQLISTNIFVNVVVPTNGFFLATSPPTSQAAPVILQPDSTLITFLNLNVLAKGTFTGTVNLALSGVPTGVTATLTPSVADLSLSPVQVVQIHFQTTTGLAGFGPSIVTVTGTSGPLAASAPVFVALQIVSAIQTPGTQTVRAPEILQVLPPGGYAGSHMIVTLQGSGLSSVTQVMSGSTKLSAQIEPGGSDMARRLVIFVRPDAPAGTYTLMLVSTRGLVPVGINITTESIVEIPDGPGPDGRPVNRSSRIGTRQAGGVMSRRGTQEDGGVTGGASHPIITRVEPASLKPGDVVVGKLFGENLRGVTAVRAVGLGISVEVLEARDTEIRVRFSVAANTPSGSRMLSPLPGGSRGLGANAMLEIMADRVAAPVRSDSGGAATQAAAVPTLQGASVETPEASETPLRPGVRRGAAPAAAGSSAAATAGAAELVVRASDITMSPASPRPGDEVTFRVLLTNRGKQNADDVEVEFTLSGANVRVRERFSVAAGGSQSFQVQWQAAGSGRIEPRVVIDPERRINLASRTYTTAAMPAFELFTMAGPAGRAPAAMRERGQLTLTSNGCQGFRFSSGTEQSCNGGADFEVRLAPQGGALRIEADGVRNLGAIAFEQADQVARGSAATAETVLPGSVYLVETRRGAVLVRVLEIRGLNAIRAAVPTALNRPRLSDAEGPQATAPQNNITLVLEWRPLSQ